jgi:biopolymer transport protein ExbD
MSRNRVKIQKMPLTSLMDVFTILVFFLLVNSGSVEVLDAPREVTLPESIVESKPRETVVIFISPDEILVQGESAGLVEQVLQGDQLPLQNVQNRLALLSEKVIGTSTMTVAATKEVTILADKSVPFTVVRQIMSTCTGAGYENVSLAVIQKGAAQQVAAL